MAFSNCSLGSGIYNEVPGEILGNIPRPPESKGTWRNFPSTTFSTTCSTTCSAVHNLCTTATLMLQRSLRSLPRPWAASHTFKTIPVLDHTELTYYHEQRVNWGTHSWVAVPSVTHLHHVLWTSPLCAACSRVKDERLVCVWLKAPVLGNVLIVLFLSTRVIQW